MDSKQLCTKCKIDEKTLAAWASQGLPRQKVAGKWVYDEPVVARWIRQQARQRAGPIPEPSPSSATEQNAATVHQCLRMMREKGFVISERIFRSRMTEHDFPGKPGTAGKQDGDFPVNAIIAWLGGGRTGEGSKTNSIEGPRVRLMEARARKEEIELAKLELRIVERERAEATLARVMAVLKTACDAIPDLVVSSLPEEVKPRARADVEENLRKAFEVIADVIVEDQEEEELELKEETFKE
jgi:phage terminase Nu1 subunit (DNA packaging protein)